MNHLASFWSAAASLSGRLDLSLLRDAGPPSQWPSLSRSALTSLGVAPRHASALLAGRPLSCADLPVTQADPRYPAGLAALPFAPPVLFCRGNLDRLATPGIAVVGARRCTGDGARFARRLAWAVADRGGVVVSGMAYGIDAAAHEAAAGQTVAVVGQGLGRPFSGAQRRLSERILAEGGLLVSEFVPQRAAGRETFPQRNRVISGLSRATVVVEATLRSGSLITARTAAEQGREVLAVPGHPTSPEAAGCLRLLRDGARLCLEPEDAVAELPLPERAGEGVGPPAAADPVLAALADGPQGFAALVLRTGLDPVALTQELSLGVLLGTVQPLPGDAYALRGGARRG